jgi:hypothetical protein
LSVNGEVLESRTTASSHEQQEHARTRVAWSEPFALHPQLMQCPFSRCYSHPYLVATLSDNTLVAHLVTSNEDTLEIGAGRRLWGHTSAISSVEVDARGKTITVSRKGDDIRVWELEGLGTAWRSSTRIEPAQGLSMIAAAIARRGNGLGGAVRSVQDEAAIANGWVGFDDEQVVVLGERSRQQILSCYDFDFT